MSSGGAPSTALVITASVTAALVTAALGEALRRLWAAPPPREAPSAEELVALVLAAQEAAAGRADRPAAPAARRALDLGAAAGSRGAYSPHGSYRNESSPHRGGSSRDDSRGMRRSASVGSDMDEHEQHAEQQPARHTEDAVLRQMNLHLMGRGHAKSARDAVAMYSSVPGNLTPNKTKVVRVALTGGPCAGKSSALEHLVERATHEGFDIMTAPEVATLYFNSSYQLPSASSEDFMEQL